MNCALQNHIEKGRKYYVYVEIYAGYIIIVCVITYSKFKYI